MDGEQGEPEVGLAAMPMLPVVLTLGVLGVMHLGQLWADRGRVEWSGAGLEGAFLDASVGTVRAPVNRLRADLGLEANGVMRRGAELYYLPDIEHVAARSFMADAERPGHVVRRPERAVDPVRAIAAFDRELRERGARLVLLPTPSKAMFARGGAEVMRNAGDAAFLREMEERGIAVFDPAEAWGVYQGQGGRLFLRGDSHWTPEAMRLTAILLAAFLEREGLVPAGRRDAFHATTRMVTNAGDLARLWDGAGRSEWEETVAMHPVSRIGDQRAAEIPWGPDLSAPLLLLGDSFTNVFSLGEMGWGEDGGLAETLSQSLGYAVDRIARNADGAFASREELQRSPGRLEGKQVVVWQFAARELSFGDWKVLDPSARARVPDGEPGLAGAMELEGTIAAVAKLPPLTRTPYRQAVLEIHLREVRSTEGEVPSEVVLLGMGVEERIPTALARWKAGERRKVIAVPWATVRERFGRLHRIGLEDPEQELLEVKQFWIVD